MLDKYSSSLWGEDRRNPDHASVRRRFSRGQRWRQRHAGRDIGRSSDGRSGCGLDKSFFAFRATVIDRVSGQSCSNAFHRPRKNSKVADWRSRSRPAWGWTGAI